MKKIRLAAALTASAVVIAGAASGCTSSSGTSSGESSLSSAIKYGGVLEVPGGDPMPDNFNPLDPAQTAGTASGTGSALYEPLIYDDPYTNELTYMLATGYRWSNGNKTLTFAIRQGVKWSDGTPFSAADVAFTFNYLKKYPALDGNGLWKTTLSSVTAPSSDTVVFQFSAPYTAIFPQIVGQEIVPEHIWSKIANPVTYTNPHPVGTGPFLLKSYSPTNVSYVKNPHYWMPGKPYIAELDYEASESDDTEEFLLLNGSVQYAYDALTDPAKTFVAADPSTNHYWWPVSDLNFLYFNTTVAPFNTAYFRKAIAMTINDNVVAQRAYFGSIPGASGPEETGVTTGEVNEWIPPSLTNLEWSYDPAAALKLLESHGYKLVGGSLEAPGGKVLPTFNILTGTGWTDFISMAQTVSQELLQLGIHTTVDEEPGGTYVASSDDGDYQMMISWGNGSGPTPYYMYYYLFSPSMSAPIGKDAATDWERYTNPAVTAALTQFSETSDLALQKEDMLQIEKNVLENVPVVALTGRPNFANYSTREFTGFPSASDPYNDADPSDGFGGGAEMMYLNVHLK
jgi:peptide/nickel transport system substrate-binding protein